MDHMHVCCVQYLNVSHSTNCSWHNTARKKIEGTLKWSQIQKSDIFEIEHTSKRRIFNRNLKLIIFIHVNFTGNFRWFKFHNGDIDFLKNTVKIKMYFLQTRLKWLSYFMLVKLKCLTHMQFTTIHKLYRNLDYVI